MATIEFSPQPSADGGADKLVNRLADSTSPYVRAHKDDLVAWQEWNESSIALARKLDRLIFLSIGYSSSHWCSVMQRESFMSPDIAALLNDHFVPIKVDRESRPDIDEMYMNYLTATTRSGGYPLNVFITSDLDPVFGGTYWPGPTGFPQPGIPAEEALTFIKVLKHVRDTWQTQRQRCIQSAKDAFAELKAFAEEGMHGVDGSESEPLELDLLDEAFNHFKQVYDKVNGGFIHEPKSKFPRPPNLGFLVALGGASSSSPFAYPKPVRSIAGDEVCSEALDMVEHTLISMSRGGIRDLIGHGFHRFSVTLDWTTPSFEKMLYDNAQLLSVYCAAFSVTHNLELLGVVYSLVDYLTSSTSSIVSKTGALFSSEDADSLPTKSAPAAEKREGAYYVFMHKELSSILPDEQAVQLIARHYSIRQGGNVDYSNDPYDELLGQNTLSIGATPSKLAKDLGHSEDHVVKVLKQGKKLLAEYRDRERPRPDVDTKIVTGWNALAIKGLVDAYIVLADVDTEKAKEALEAAKKIANFIKQELYDSSTNKLARIYSFMPDGTGRKDDGEGFLSDYAYLIQASIALYEATFDIEWLKWADTLQGRANDVFLSPDGLGYYSTPAPTVPSTTTVTSSEPATESSSLYNPPHSLPTTGPANLPLRLKPGTDSAEPSANAVVAQNLLQLSALLNDSHYSSLASSTINAFGVEIIQHPFLFVGILNAIVQSQVGIRNVVIVTKKADLDAASISTILKEKDITRDSRTVVSVVQDAPESWLKQRNALFKDIKVNEDGHDIVLICEKGALRELRDGEKLVEQDE